MVYSASMAIKNSYENGELLTAAEIVEILPDTTSQTVLRWAKTGKIPFGVAVWGGACGRVAG